MKLRPKLTPSADAEESSSDDGSSSREGLGFGHIVAAAPSPGRANGKREKIKMRPGPTAREEEARATAESPPARGGAPSSPASSPPDSPPKAALQPGAGADDADAIRAQLASIRGELFDVADADASVALILSKVRELTACENRVVEEQRGEIERLRRELEVARERAREGRSAPVQGPAYTSTIRRTGSYGATPDGIESVPSFGSITINSSSSIDTGNVTGASGATGFTNESERPTSYSIHANQQLATRANLSQSIAMASNELRELTEKKEKVGGEVMELEKKLEELEGGKLGVLAEIAELKGQVQLLLKERTKLVQEVEIYGDRADLASDLNDAHASNARLQTELRECREEMARVRASAREVKEQAVRQWERAVREKETAEQTLAKERKAFREAAEEVREAREEAEREGMARTEMERELRGLYEEKIGLETELEELKGGRGRDSGRQESAHKRSNNAAREADADVQRLKREIRALQGENASLRSMTKRDSEMIAGLNDEIRSLRTVDREANGAEQGAAFVGATPANTPAKGNVAMGHLASSRKRALAKSRGSVGEDERSREYKRSIRYEPQRERFGSDGSSLERIDGTSRERLGTAGSETVSELHEADSVSLLFGQESVGQEMKGDDEKSDHDEIRAHAEKLLYWANRASERSKRSDASVASQQASQIGEGGAPTPTRQSAIPATIGLTPRSAKKSSLRPPRCPPSIASGGEGEGSLKENGGSTFNRDRGADALGAFPSLTPPRQKKNVSLSETDNVIHNLDYVDESPVICCECSVSPFSGNDPQSEFYLPKLGMACTCGGNGAQAADRASFSRNPTALTSILRPWQCDFLATLDVLTADELLRAHKADANSMARSMKLWRMREGMAPCRSKECYIALKIWSRTCKVVLRSIREQQEVAAEDGAEGEDLVIEKPQFLDITFADTHTIASISTLGQMSSVGGGGRPLEMMEI